MHEPVCLDDPTSHGGKVITATSTFYFDGRRAALVDDLVSCPLFYDEARTKPHGINRIIEGIEGYTDNGRKMVVNGCHSECGCVVISQSPGMTIA